MSHLKRFMPAEWHQQDGILIAWPHLGTDWAGMIDEVTGCYIGLARAIARHERLLIVAPDPEEVRSALGEDCCGNITFYALPTNDTWTRDYGPITVIDDATGVARFHIQRMGYEVRCRLRQYGDTPHGAGWCLQSCR